MSRRNLLLASTINSGGVQEPEWPVYLTHYSDNGETGIQLYNYLISILPEDTIIMLPTTEYKIGDMIINGYGTVTICNVLSSIKAITMTNDNMREEGITPLLYSNGRLT